jgi:hypothetical protein
MERLGRALSIADLLPPLLLVVTLDCAKHDILQQITIFLRTPNRSSIVIPLLGMVDKPELQSPAAGSLGTHNFSISS